MSDREGKIKELARLRKVEKLRQLRAQEAEVQTEAVKEKPSVAESGLRGTAKGLLSGFADEAYGVVGAVVNPTDSKKGLLDRYRDSRDYARRRDDKAQAANPKAFGAAEIGGGVTQAFVPGLGALGAAGKGAKAGEVTVKAAGMGAAAGLGLSEADVTKGQVAEALRDTAVGAGTGAATAGVARYAGGKLAPSALKGTAERRATKAAIGNQGKVYDEMMAKGNVEKIGRDLLDEKVVRFGSGAKTIAKRASDAKKAAGEGIGEILDEADDTALAGRSPALDKLDFPWKQKAPVDGRRLAEKIRAYADEIAGPNNEAVVKNLRRQADKYEAMGKVSLKEANRLKSGYKWKHGENQALSQEATNKIKGLVGDEMEEAVGQVGRARAAISEPAEQFGEALSTGTGPRLAGRGGPVEGGAVLKEATAVSDKADLLKRYQAAKSKYGNMATAATGARKLAARQEKNATFGLRDIILGGAAGAATLNPLKGAAVATGSKLLRERGSSMAAVSLDKVSKILAAGGEALGPFAPVLAKAARNGNLGAVHLLLMKSQPEYLELVRQQLKEKKGT